MSTYSLNQLLGSSVTNVSSYFTVAQPKVFSTARYERNEEASFAGIFCLLTPVLFTYFCIASNALYDAMNIYMNIMITGGVIFRVIAYNWVGNIAREQNRAEGNWQMLSMILPSITLITLGYTTQLAPQQQAQQSVVSELTNQQARILQANIQSNILSNIQEEDSEDQLLRKAS